MSGPEGPGPAPPGRDGLDVSAGHGVPTCDRCGAAPPAGADRPPLTWTTTASPGGQRWLCDRCAREHLRSIEGRLDEQWWA
jgi:hypothetical protein